MIKTNKMITLTAYFIPSLSENLTSWLHQVDEFIYSQIENKTISLAEVNPTKNSMIYELSKNTNNIKVNGFNIVYIVLDSIAHEKLKSLIEEDGFYLGNCFITTEVLDDQKVTNLSAVWYKNPGDSGLEIFSVKNDGNSFYWYNPKNINADKIFLNSFNIDSSLENR